MKDFLYELWFDFSFCVLGGDLQKKYEAEERYWDQRRVEENNKEHLFSRVPVDPDKSISKAVSKDGTRSCPEIG